METTTKIVLLLEALILLPGLAYVFWGRTYRRRMILSYFTPGSIADYLDQFWAGSEQHSNLSARYVEAVQALKKPAKKEDMERLRHDKAQAEQALNQALMDLYNRRFGWLSYLIPLAALAAIIWVEGQFVADYINFLLTKNAASLNPNPENFTHPHSHLPDKITVAALAGAYLWVGLDLFRRSSSLTLLPSDFMYYSLRLVVAPALGYAVGTVAGGAETSALVAFTVALLPIGDIITWARSLSARSLNVAQPPEEARDKLTNLPGVDSTVAARLQEQGITTILQLCDADPVQLSMRTGLDFAFIVRLVDESLGWCYFGSKLLQLNAYGWSGAADITAAARGGKSEVSLEAAARQYVDAKTRYDSTTAQLSRLTADDPGRPALKAKHKDAQQDLVSAQEALQQAVTSDFDFSLIDSITKAADLKLEASGLRNIVRRLEADTYTHFISRLMSEIRAQSAQGNAAPSALRWRWLSRVVNMVREGGATPADRMAPPPAAAAPTTAPADSAGTTAKA